MDIASYIEHSFWPWTKLQLTVLNLRFCISVHLYISEFGVMCIKRANTSQEKQYLFLSSKRGSNARVQLKTVCKPMSSVDSFLK
jgi:hypothetical protein